MKFGDKYELLESLTTGGVETFIANDKVRGERVLVHILEGEQQKPNQPTVQWVLETFRRNAPEPAGLVLEAGRYSGTLYAYLVTKMPEEAALANWLQAYKAQARETQDGSKGATAASTHSDAPTATFAKLPAESFATLPPVPRQPEPPKPAAPSPISEPIPLQSFPTQPKVNPAADWPPVQTGPNWTPTPTEVPASPKADSIPGSSPGAFTAAFTPPRFPVETSPAPVKEAQLGEFTSFFQGPFRGDKSSDVPAVSLDRMEPPRKSVGEFTAIFGAPMPKEPQPAASLPMNEPAGTGFTELFSTPVVPNPPSVAGLPPSPGLSSANMPPPAKVDQPAFPGPSTFPDPVIPSKPVSYANPAPVIPIPVITPPSLPTPAREFPPVVSAPVVADRATQAFNHPGPAAAEAVAPDAGPGAYTRIISVKPHLAPPVAEPPLAASPAGPLPSFGAAAPPPMPKAPPAPKIAAPAMPKAPGAAVPEPAVSYWPLILTLTVLFFLAVLLVIYFALKH